MISNSDRDETGKQSFNQIYQAPTPHQYLAEMSRLGYQIGEQARPYCDAAATLVRELNGDACPLGMLDVGCSYGMASAFVKYGCTFEEIVSFFDSRAPKDRVACAEAMRQWLHVVQPAIDMRVVGVDVSAPAIDFGLASGLLDAGFSTDLEQDGALLGKSELDWISCCNLLICTGAIGYVSERTLGRLLKSLGSHCTGSFGPVVVLTVLRMFDVSPIEALFQHHGWKFDRVPGIVLPQRKFASEQEQFEILEGLAKRGLPISECEQGGVLTAELFVASPHHTQGALLERMKQIGHKQLPLGKLFTAHVDVACSNTQLAS